MFVYLLVGLGLLLATVLPSALEGRALSAPIVVLAVGVLAGLLLPGEAEVDPILNATFTSHLAEACVIISLMGVGLALERPLHWRTWRPTWRLLAIGMPLCMVAVAGLGWAVLGLTLPAAVLLAAVLAPTDPVLASDVQVEGPVVADMDEVEEDEVRFALTSEAGLNDALAFPFVYLGLFMMGRGAFSEWGLEWLLWTLVGKIVVGALVGWACGLLLGRMAFRSRTTELRVADTGNPLLALAATFAVYGVTELIGGYGFLAVFAAALAMRSVERKHDYHRDMHLLIHQLETILTLVLLLMLGAALTAGLLERLTWPGVLLGVVLVFVVRPLSGWVSLAGVPELRGSERWAVASFGVRGIGSIYYLTYALSSEYIAEGLELWSVVAFTIVLSVVVHGIAATPVMRRLDDERRGTAGAVPA
jgi:NhaP-type Na+/H+ or K+/H+ antiporter